VRAHTLDSSRIGPTEGLSQVDRGTGGNVGYRRKESSGSNSLLSSSSLSMRTPTGSGSDFLREPVVNTVANSINAQWVRAANLQTEFEDRFVEWLICMGHSLHCLDHSLTRELFHEHLKSGRVIPGRKKARTTITDRLVNEVESVVDGALNNRKICVSTDTWSDTRNRSFSNWCGRTDMGSRALIAVVHNKNTSKKDAAFYLKQCKEILTRIKRSGGKTVALVTDNASVMKKTQLLLKEVPEWKDVEMIGCFPHVINLFFNDVFGRIKVIISLKSLTVTSAAKYDANRAAALAYDSADLWEECTDEDDGDLERDTITEDLFASKRSGVKWSDIDEESNGGYSLPHIHFLCLFITKFVRL
jgi:Protein of unknown function (DUF 659)